MSHEITPNQTPPGFKLRHTLRGYTGVIYRIAWSPDGRTLASGSNDSTVQLWVMEAMKLDRVLEGHSAVVYSVAWSPDGRTLAAGCRDKTIRLWDRMRERLHTTLEGHTNFVKSVAFSFDNSFLASKSSDGTVRLWRRPSWDNVVMLDEPTSNLWPPALAFHPAAPVLATLGEGDMSIRIWDLDFKVLFTTVPVSRRTSDTNAKVALVGDTGVGKTGLGVRLAEGKWHPTPGSTHGMNVWTLHSEPERERWRVDER